MGIYQKAGPEIAEDYAVDLIVPGRYSPVDCDSLPVWNRTARILVTTLGAGGL